MVISLMRTLRYNNLPKVTQLIKKKKKEIYLTQNFPVWFDYMTFYA